MTLALALVLLIQVPSIGPRSAPLAAGPIGAPVTFRTDATETEIAAAGARLVASYDAFSFARGSEGTLAVLRAHGRYAEP
ncbi:MAG TPA: hypothetical protein VNO76_03210, partial [Thermoplasmata archaeon]|nr:hypothetical protein [Thermoplasmata archaeon]